MNRPPVAWWVKGVDVNLRTEELYRVIAEAPSGATKVVAAKVGAFKATRLAVKVEALGFKAHVSRVDKGSQRLLVLED